MNKFLVPLSAFALLLFLGTSYTGVLSQTHDRGWHSQIYPSYFKWLFVVLLLLIFWIIGRWLVRQKPDKLDWTLFGFHGSISVAAATFVHFPGFFAGYQGSQLSEDLMNKLVFRIQLIPTLKWTFVVGQGLFLVYFLRNIRNNDNKIIYQVFSKNK